jgi:hypothetical protein
MIPQIIIRQKESQGFSDDIIFSKDKKGVFQLVVLVDTIREAEIIAIEIEKGGIASTSAGLILPSEATFIIHNPRPSSEIRQKNFVFAMSSDEYKENGFEPKLKGYDKERIKKEFPSKKFLVVRPDRYTFGTAIAIDGVQNIAKRAREMILGAENGCN